MRTLEHEGHTYILKSDMEEIIKERISKVASRANEAETQVKELSNKLSEAEKKTSSADILASRVEELQSQLDKSQNRFERYQAISKHGLVDEDMVEAVEWSYERSQKNVSEKERKTLGEWLDNQIKNPEKAHALLRPHLKQLTKSNTEESQNQDISISKEAESEQPQDRPAPPIVNNGTIRAPNQQGDIIDIGIKDDDFYKANREKIHAAWYARNNRR